MYVAVLFSPENFANIPIILRDSVEITEHEPEVSERFTAWNWNSNTDSCKSGILSHVHNWETGTDFGPFHSSDSVSVQQASDEFTFTEEKIQVSVVTPAISQQIHLTKGLRQTLLIPSDLNGKWLLVSQRPQTISQ